MPDFTTLAKVKVALKISRTEDDANITALVPQVTDLILQRMLRANFFKNGADVTEFPYIRTESDVLHLSRYPGGVVTSIHESEDVPRVYDATTLLVANTDYLLDAAHGLVYKMAGTWAMVEQAVEVIYDGGYTDDTDAPASLGRAAEMIIAAMLQKGKDRLYHATGTQLGDGKLQGVRWEDVPDTAKSIILSYRDERI